jgi:hypothetical protein
MFKKEKVQEDPARERQKPTATNDETAAYEDSWYRSLKALADRRRNHDETQPADDGRPSTNGHARHDGGAGPADADGMRPEGDMRRAGDDETVSVPED